MKPGSAFDYVIVGAGSAGCVVAARLAEQENARVLLLEAGGWDRDPWIRIPIGWGRIMTRRLHDWGYDAEPEPALNARTIECMRGKVVGGSSSINAMTYVRGNRRDYDRWAAGGLPHLAYESVLPYFKRQESWEGGESRYRGGSGPLSISFSRYADPLIDACLTAAQDAGHRLTDDYNGAEQEGFGVLQSTIRNGRRCSAADAYLRPALGRTGLEIATRATVTGLGFDGDRAVSVDYVRDGRRLSATADREIILCGGAINSPQLLMLAGIGDPEHLAEHGIRVRSALPGVGRNLQDHASVAIEYRRKGHGPFVENMRIDRLLPALANAYVRGKGFATDLPSGWTAFLRSRFAGDIPDIQLIFRAVPMHAGPWFPLVRRPFEDGFAVRAVLVRPESKGRILLRSADPTAHVRIHQNHLAAGRDRAVLREGMHMIRDFASRPALARYIESEIAPGIGATSDPALDAHISAFAATAHHPVGTCRMGTGNDRDLVLDAEFRVRGVRNLRVVDASAFPDIINGNVNAPVMMLAEIAADLIRGTKSSARRAPDGEGAGQAPAA